MTDRDTFAAAALTGLLSNVQRYQNEPLTRQAFEIADFMLRERGNRPEKPDSSTVAESATTAEPVAWAALRDDGDIAWIGYTPEGAADGACGRLIVPLYRQPQPTLTDAEREAIADAADRYAALAPESAETVATLRGLLERMK